MNDVSNDTSDPNKQVTFNKSVNVKYASNPTITTSLITSSKPASFKSSQLSRTPGSTNELSINKLATNQTINQSAIKSLKSSNLINQLKLFKLQQPASVRSSELNKISDHNQPRKMRTIQTTFEKNVDSKSKYGQLNKTSQSNSLLNKAAKSKSGIVVDEKTTVSKEPIKGIFDTGPVLTSTTLIKNLDHYKLPYGKGENIETDEFGEQTWKHRNVRAYEEKTKRKIRQEFDVPASAVAKKLNEPYKLDKNDNDESSAQTKSAQKKYIYGMNLSGGGKSEAVPHSNGDHIAATTRTHSPFKELSKLNTNGRFMVDKAVQCELKRSKTQTNERNQFSETGWKHFVEEPEEPKFREFSRDKWYYDQDEYEIDERVPTTSRQVSGIGEHHQVHKWTKDINPSSLEHKTELEKKVNTEYKHNLTGSFKVIKPDKHGNVTTYSNVRPLTNKNLGLNSAGQQVVSRNKSGEVIYSQVDKSKKRILRDQMHTPLPGYRDPDSAESEDEIELKQQQIALKNSRLSSRSPSPVNRTRTQMICLDIPSEKQKAKLHRERSPSPHILDDHPRSASTGPRVIRNRTYRMGYGHPNDNTIEPPPQFATLGHKLPPKAPTPVKSMLHRSSSAINSVNPQMYGVRRIPIEADSKWYYQTEQSNLSDQSSVFGLKKNRETLEETMSFVSSGSEFVDKELLGRDRIADSTIRELDRKKREISYDNQPMIRHSKNDAPISSSVWYKSMDEDYRKGMAANEICMPSLQDSATMSRLDKKSSSIAKKGEQQAYTLDKRYLDERKKGILITKSGDKVGKNITRRPTQQASDFVDNRIVRGTSNTRQFSSTRDLSQPQPTGDHLKLSDRHTKQRSASLTRYNESESDVSIASARGLRALSGLNYALKPVTRSASMHQPANSSLLRKHSSAIRSTESDHGYSASRPISRQSQASATHRFTASGQTLIQNDPIVLRIPAIDNSVKQTSNTLITNAKNKSSSKAMCNKKLASSVNNLSSVSRTNSILSKLKPTTSANTGSKKDVSKSSDKLNELTVKLNGYQNSKTLATKLKRSQSIPSNANLFQKLRNKLKSKEQ